ncbi:myosin-7B-like isoform X3 [Scylla paramamosain]|uniref:myosin-7B-like isoform X3 n=1 Tax=Scylla paramamosain TaxID=85552 RepID=UPI0030836C06
MLGDGVVVVGAGGAPLHRPRSADNLSRLTAASSIPALDDLAESEVFVGDEDDELECGEAYLRPPLPPIDPGLPGEVTPPDLLSPPCPPSSTSLVIAYHEEALRLPLDAVKEEVEAEALEEASMILSSGPASLGHASLGPCSLTSSMVSSASLEDSTLSSRTDTFDTVIAAIPDFSPSPPDAPTSTSPPPRSSATRPGNKDAARVASTSARTSPTSPRGSSGRSSPRTSTDSPSTPEKRRGTSRSEGGSNTSSRGSTPRGTPRVASSRGEDKKTPRGTARGTTGVRPCARAQDARRDTHTHAHTRTKAEESRGTTLTRKKKVEADSRPSTAPTRKKETSATVAADKYGSLGRRRRVKDATGDAKDGGKESGTLTRDSKQTLDMYATLPRRRAKEVSARWKEQMASEDDASRPSLRRTKSVGKSEGAASSATAKGRSSLMTTSLPASALRPRSPRANPPAKSTSTSTSNLAARKEKTIICMEASTQTALTGGDVASALRAMSRQNSLGAEEDEEVPEVTRPHAVIVREESTPDELPPSRSVEVELAWRLGEGDLPEHVRRLTEEHARLQNEHSRARVRLEEMESLRDELQKLKVSLEEERAEKEEVQGELDRTSQRVKDMLVSMEGVEHEFNSRGDSLLELESQLHQSADIHIQMQERLNRFEECNLKIKRDLDKSVAAQKTLLQQVQDLENESREMADFMAEEKNALAECLREAESELMKLKSECNQLNTKLKEKEDEVRHVTRVAEDRRNKYMQLQSEMSSIQCRTRDMMVCQGAEVSGAAVSLNNVSSRLRALIAKLVQDYTITDADLEMIVTPSESDSSASSTNGTPEHKPPGIKAATRRTPSPRKTASFMTALLSAMRMGPTRSRMGDLGGAICSLTNGSSKEQVTEGRNSPEGSESHELVEGSSASSSLTDQVTEMDVLLTRFLKVCCVLKNESDLQLAETEDENDRLSNQLRSQQQVIEQQHSDYEVLACSEARARKELAAVTHDLEVANKNLTKYFEAEYDHQVMKLQNEVEKLGGTVRHLEALNEEKERQLEEALSRLSAAQESAPANHVSEASHYREVSCLSDKVTSLRQSVMEREKQIIELSDRHAKDLASLREAQGQTQYTSMQLTSTVENVLKPVASKGKVQPKTFHKIRPYNPKVPRLWKGSQTLCPAAQPSSNSSTHWLPMRNPHSSSSRMGTLILRMALLTTQSTTRTLMPTHSPLSALPSTIRC